MLAALMDKSLIQRDTSGRWAMHELVRQYAAQQLSAIGEESTISARHATFYREWTERAERDSTTESQRELLRRLDAEQGNIRAALAWSLDGGDCACGLAIANAMQWYWFVRGQLLEGRQWLEPALACGRALGATRELTGALMALGLFIGFTSDFVECRRLLEEGIAVGQSVGEAAERYVALCHRYIGFVAMFEGRLVEARTIFEELLAYHRQVASEGRDRNNRRLGSMLVSYSELAYAEGNLDEALAAVTEALPLMRASGDGHGLAATLDSSRAFPWCAANWLPPWPTGRKVQPAPESSASQ